MSEKECDGEEGENSSASRRRGKESSFGVETKAFKIVVDDRKGKPQVPHHGEEGRGFVMGPTGTGKLRVFHRRPKPLHQGQERSKMGKGMEGKWEIVFHDMRDKQSRGVIRLEVFDLEKKSFCIFIPRGR